MTTYEQHLLDAYQALRKASDIVMSVESEQQAEESGIKLHPAYSAARLDTIIDILTSEMPSLHDQIVKDLEDRINSVE